MSNPSKPSPGPIRISTPCPKTWSELTGDAKKRFCSECSLHVHNAAQLTRTEAQSLISGATSRVCMRIEYDAQGAPVFIDSKPAAPVRAPAPLRPAARVARWVLSAASGLLAACHGEVSPPTPSDPPKGPNDVPVESSMGIAAPAELGDVALPPPRVPEVMGGVVEPPVMGEVAMPPQVPETMGKVASPVQPQAPKPGDPPSRDGE